MSTHARAGIRAARALLSLLEENSSEELEAAESILGGEKELIDILQMLRKYQQHEAEPLSIDRLRDVVRKEILDLPLSLKDLVTIIHDFKGTAEMRMPSRLAPESVLDQALRHLEAINDVPSEYVAALIKLLLTASARTSPEQEVKITSLLRELAIQALTENLIFFPTLHALAQIRTQWDTEPLPYNQQETRRNVASRLLKDIAHAPISIQHKIMAGLIRDGLRGPGDAQIAAVRRMKPKKAQSE